MYTSVGGNEARGGALLLTWLEENYEAVRQFYGDTFVTNVKTMLRGFPEESSTEAEHQRLQARIDNEFAFNLFQAVLWIRIRRDRIFLSLLDADPLVRGTDPDPLVRGTDPDPLVTRYISGSGSSYHQAKIVRLYDFLS